MQKVDVRVIIAHHDRRFYVILDRIAAVDLQRLGSDRNSSGPFERG
jgi:hypothetical protein